MTDPDDPAGTLRVHLHQHISRLRGFARILAGKQKWADLCVAQLLDDLLIDPRLFNLASTPRVALYTRLLHLLSVVLQENALSDRPFVTPAARQAHLLTTVEGFTRTEAAAALNVSLDQLEVWLEDTEVALAHQRGARIMIVEDEAFIALELEFMVDDLGHKHLDTATTLSEAVDKALLLKPDLILSDVQLADGSSGIEAAQVIKTHSDVPIIFITANPEQLLTGRRPEPAFIIKKPFNKNVAQALIGQTLFLNQKNFMPVHEQVGVLQPGGQRETNPNDCTQDTIGVITGSADVSVDNLVDKAVFANYVAARRPERVLQTLTIFAAELDEKVTAMSALIKNHDVDALRSLTHSMLGSAVMLGAQRMVYLSSILQRECLKTQAINWSSVDELKLVAKQTASLFKNLGTMRELEEFIDQAASRDDRGQVRRLDGVD